MRTIIERCPFVNRAYLLVPSTAAQTKAAFSSSLRLQYRIANRMAVDCVRYLISGTLLQTFTNDIIFSTPFDPAASLTYNDVIQRWAGYKRWWKDSPIKHCSWATASSYIEGGQCG